ncbi:MAG: hypothetical protein H7315_18120, partial [Herminiimonas sp.]|nr:hypothetical protein [Herminiimonas sp.]
MYRIPASEGRNPSDFLLKWRWRLPSGEVGALLGQHAGAVIEQARITPPLTHSEHPIIVGYPSLLRCVMAKAKINFEVDEIVLSRAKAYVALHGGSLNKLVNAFFSNLGKQVDVPFDPAKKILMDLSVGRISLVQATADLNLPDAGYTLHLMAEEGLPMPHL